MSEATGWWADDEDMPEVVRRWMRAPEPGDPPYDYRRVGIFFDALTPLAASGLR